MAGNEQGARQALGIQNALRVSRAAKVAGNHLFKRLRVSSRRVYIRS